MDNPIDLQGK